MVTLLVFFIILIDTVFITLFFVLTILALVFRLEATLLLVLSFSTETGLCFPHLIEFFVTCMIFVFKNFIFLVFSMLIL
jgi:hypothetical protein